MKARRIKFLWGASKVVQGRWYFGLFGLYNRHEGNREDGLALSVRGLLILGVMMALTGWVALATAGFWIWERNPYSQLTYTDALLYPLRRAAIAEKRGQAAITQGMELARGGKWHDAANLLKYGLTRSPRELRGRLMLAQYYQLTNQRAFALKVLEEGLESGYPGRSYLEAWFNILAQGEEHEVAAEICARFLPEVMRDGPVVDARWLAGRRYAALTAAERHAEALALAETESGETRDEHRVLSLVALGRSPEAIALLAEWRARAGADLKRVARLDVRAFRAAGRYEDMDRALAELRERSPGEPDALGYAVTQEALAGRDAAAKAALDDYIFRFSGSVENLVLVATPLAEIGNLPLLEQCAAAARERGFSLGRFQFLLLDVHLERGEWEAAARIYESIPVPADKNAWEKLVHAWLQRLIEAARSQEEVPQQALTEFLRTRPWPLKILRGSIQAMMRAEHLEAARDLIELASRAYPASKWLQMSAAEVKLRLLARTPAVPAEPAAAAAAATSEVLFLRRLESLLAAKHWAEAGRHIAQAQNLVPAPAWLVRQEAPIGLAQVKVAVALGEPRQLVIAARLYLNGETARGNALLEVAREAFATGDKATALLLVREIVRRTPEHAAAQASWREWDPAGGDTSAAAENDLAPPIAATESPLAQMRAHQAAGDVPGLLAATRLTLTGDQARAESVVALAREFMAAGDRNAAELVLREVLRRHGDFRPAMRLLAGFPPASAPKK